MEGTTSPQNWTHGRAVLVDSTRRGKRMPDALSKTVPIWCAVMNGFVRDNWMETTFPEDVVSEQEISSIEELLPSFLTSLKVLSFKSLANGRAVDSSQK
jgi:tRNA A64-2'-O-ribosylphosphate transferase